jgi:hypothetical protein
MSFTNLQKKESGLKEKEGIQLSNAARMRLGNELDQADWENSNTK